MEGPRSKSTKPQLYTKNSRQLRKTGRRRSVLPQGRAYPLLFQCQVVRPEIMHTSNIKQTRQVLFRNIDIFTYAYIYTCNRTIDDKAGMNFRASQMDTSEGSEEGKGRKKCFNYIHRKEKTFLLLLLSWTFRLSFPTHHVVRGLHPFFLD